MSGSEESGQTDYEDGFYQYDDGGGAGSASEHDSDEFASASPNGFYDLEAEEESEDDDNESEDDELDEDIDFNAHLSKRRETKSFPQFCALPPEIRAEIWSHFCPDLNNSVVYPIRLEGATGTNQYGMQYADPDNPLVVKQTELSRALFSISAETRQLAFQRFPDRLPLPLRPRSKALAPVLPFNRDRDVIFLERGWTKMADAPAFFAVVQNLAVSLEDVFIDEEDYDLRGDGDISEDEMETLAESRCSMLPRFFGKFCNLKNVYLHCQLDLCRFSNDVFGSMWCISPDINCYEISLQEREDVSVETRFTYFWPDLRNHRQFATREIDVKRTWRSLHGCKWRSIPGRLGLRPHLGAGYELWPLVEVIGDETEGNLDKILNSLRVMYTPDGAHRPGASDMFYPLEGESGSESEDEDDSLDGFIVDEDDGADDGAHDGADDGGVDVSSEEIDHDVGDDSSETFEGFSPARESSPSRVIDLTVDSETANFSSPEPLPADEQDRPEPSASQRRRRRVVDSADEEEDEEDVPSQRKRQRVGHHILVESDEGE